MAIMRAVLYAFLLGAGGVSAAFLEEQSEGATIAKQLEDLREQEKLITEEEAQVRKEAERQAVLRSTVAAEEDTAHESDVLRKQLSRQQAIIELQRAQAKAAQLEAAKAENHVEEQAKEDQQELQQEEIKVAENVQPQPAVQPSLVEETTTAALEQQLNMIMVAVSGGAFQDMPPASIGIWRDFAIHMQKALAGNEAPSDVEAFVELHKDADTNLPKLMSIVEQLSQEGNVPESLPESLEVLKRSMMFAGELKKPKELQKQASAMSIMEQLAPYLPSPQDDPSVAAAMAVAQKIESLQKKVEGSDVSLVEAFHDSMLLAREKADLEDKWKSMRADLKAHRVSEAMDEATMPHDLGKLREEVMHLRVLMAKEGVTPSKTAEEGTGALFQAASHGSSMIALAGEIQKDITKTQQMQRIVLALTEVDEDIKANHEYLKSVKERAAKMAPELAGMNKLLTGAGKELRSRDAAWAHKTSADLAKKGSEVTSLLQKSNAKLEMSREQKLQLAGQNAFNILAAAAEDARETLPMMMRDEDEWKFVEKFSSSLTKALQSQGLKLNPAVMDAAAKVAEKNKDPRTGHYNVLIRGLPTALMQRSSITVPMDNDLLYADEFGKKLYRAMYK